MKLIKLIKLIKLCNSEFPRLGPTWEREMNGAPRNLMPDHHFPYENGNFGSYQEENGQNDGRIGQDGSGSEWCDDICFTTLRTGGSISYTKSASDIFDMFDADGGNNDDDDDKKNVIFEKKMKR